MSFVPMQFPTLETDRLKLRGLIASDLEGFCEIYGDAEHAKYVGGVKSKYQCWEKLTSLIGHWQVRGFGRFAIEEKSSGEFVGHCGPSETGFVDEPEMNYTIRPRFMGKGYATEAVKQAIGYVYDELNWPTIISLVDKDNDRSEAVSKRLGATLEGEITSYDNYKANVWRHLPPQEFRERHA